MAVKRILTIFLILLVPSSVVGQTDAVSILDLRVSLKGDQQTWIDGLLVLQLNLRANEAEHLLYIFQVKDSDGYTAHISFRDVALAAGEERIFSSVWIPQMEGTHVVEAFVWKSAPSYMPLTSNVPRLELHLEQASSVEYCTGTSQCFAGIVTRIIDGDTLEVGNVRIRLALVDTPERGQPGFTEATAFTSLFCPVGSTVIVDQDDGQEFDRFGRMVAKVWCGEKNINAELLYSGHARMFTQFCSVSEFAGESWAKEHGCD